MCRLLICSVLWLFLFALCFRTLFILKYYVLRKVFFLIIQNMKGTSLKKPFKVPTIVVVWYQICSVLIHWPANMVCCKRWRRMLDTIVSRILWTYLIAVLRFSHSKSTDTDVPKVLGSGTYAINRLYTSGCAIHH